jgi:hypothetical protein
MMTPQEVDALKARISNLLGSVLAMPFLLEPNTSTVVLVVRKGEQRRARELLNANATPPWPIALNVVEP